MHNTKTEADVFEREVELIEENIQWTLNDIMKHLEAMFF